MTGFKESLVIPEDDPRAGHSEWTSAQATRYRDYHRADRTGNEVERSRLANELRAEGGTTPLVIEVGHELIRIHPDFQAEMPEA